ncbi:MAG TPA: VOC family protein [Terracidiphilus sp.]|nr:VOC family protein [Terracidiphilus sp.]
MSHPDAAPGISLEKIGQIAITVDNLSRARDFYQNTLGMKFLFDAGHLAFFKCGDIRLMLSTPDKPGTRGGTILYFKVDDIQGTFIALKQRGAVFIDAPHLIAKMPDHDLWMAFLNDTEGNTIGIMSEVPRTDLEFLPR